MPKVQQGKDGVYRIAIPKGVASNTGLTKGDEVEVKSDDRCGGVNVRKIVKPKEGSK